MVTTAVVVAGVGSWELVVVVVVVVVVMVVVVEELRREGWSERCTRRSGDDHGFQMSYVSGGGKTELQAGELAETAWQTTCSWTQHL